MQRHQAVELVGEMRAPFRLADGEGLLLAVIGRRQMIDAGQQRAELLAVVDDAADRDAAEADAVIAALAADQPHARALAAHVVIGERDLQRGVDRLRAGIAEEHMIEIAGRQRGDAARQFEGLRMARTGRSARKSSSAAWAWIAATIGSRLCPALVHHRPAAPSISLRPSGVK